MRLIMCRNFEILKCIKYYDHFFFKKKKFCFLCFLNNGALEIHFTNYKITS